MSNMFDSFSQNMESLDLGAKFDTSKVTNMESMFMNCGVMGLKSLNLGDKFDTINVTNMRYMFASCGNLEMTNLDLGDKFDTSNVTSMGIYGMFQSCGANKMETLNYGATVADFESKCASLMENATSAYFIQSNFKSCNRVTCRDGNYVIP